MSYILDALRRADAERERGAVPGLHAQQFTLSPDDDEGTNNRSRTLLYVSIGLGAALIAALAWKLLGSDPPVPPPALPMAAPPAPAWPTTAAPTAGTLPMAATASASAAMTIARPALSPTSAATTTMTPATPARSPRAPASAPVSRPPAGATTANPTAPPGNRIYTQAELPEDVRRGLPKLSVGGASYSSDAASRMVIINGQVLHEGDKIGNGLVLQQIKLKTAVLSTKGYRFEITY